MGQRFLSFRFAASFREINRLVSASFALRANKYLRSSVLDEAPGGLHFRDCSGIVLSLSFIYSLILPMLASLSWNFDRG